MQNKAGPDWLISAILSGALWLIKGGGLAERLQELLVFFSQQMEETTVQEAAVDVRRITEMLEEDRMNSLERWQPEHHDTNDTTTPAGIIS